MKAVSLPTLRGLAGCGLPALVLGVLAFFTATLSAQTGSLDSTFNPNVTGGFGTVLATAVQPPTQANPDVKIIIGGSFTTVGSTARANIARLNANGSVDTTFDPGTGVDNPVYCVAVQADGKILLGGYFFNVGGQARNYIARLNDDGSLDPTFNPGANYTVHSLAVQADGKILLGGNFTTVAGATRNGLARLNADGTLESTTTFDPGSGANDYVYSVAVQTDGKILLGGYFTTMNGATRNGIARLNANGSVEDLGTFNAGTGADNAVRSIAVQADGKILLGGNFTSVNGQSRIRIARLHADGSVEDTATFNPGAGADYPVYGVAVQADGKIFLSGSFYSVNGQTRISLARLTATGALDATFNPGTFNDVMGVPVDVNGVAVQADGRVVVGGPFVKVNSTARNAIARLNNDPATQSVVIPNSGQVQWLRSGGGPEVTPVTFEFSTNGGTTWNVLGSGTRIAGGWQLTGLTLPSSGSIRARGRTSGGLYSGSSGLVEQVQTFTLAPPPTVATLAAGGVAGTGAILNGTVNANGSSSDVTFEYGTTAAYGSTVTAAPSPITGSSPVAVSATVTGLTYGTTYHYRVRGANNGGAGDGGDVTFTTPTPIEDWRQIYFADPTGIGLGADDAAPDHDGIPNLLKYTLVIAPGTSGASALPYARRRTYAEGDRLAVLFTRDPARHDLTIFVEAADSPGGPWTQVLASSVNGAAMTGPGVVGETDAGGGRKTVEVRDIVNMSAGLRRFLHIRSVH